MMVLKTRHGDTADDDGFHIISEPDNENRCQSCLWQAVQDNESRAREYRQHCGTTKAAWR